MHGEKLAREKNETAVGVFWLHPRHSVLTHKSSLQFLIEHRSRFRISSTVVPRLIEKMG